MTRPEHFGRTRALPVTGYTEQQDAGPDPQEHVKGHEPGSVATGCHEDSDSDEKDQ
jgi:hypothetical protein